MIKSWLTFVPGVQHRKDGNRSDLAVWGTFFVKPNKPITAGVVSIFWHFWALTLATQERFAAVIQERDFGYAPIQTCNTSCNVVQSAGVPNLHLLLVHAERRSSHDLLPSKP